MAALFALLTCQPSRDVAPAHPNAMPVILTGPDEWRRWRTAAASEALELQRSLSDGILQIVAEGVREDV